MLAQTDLLQASLPLRSADATAAAVVQHARFRLRAAVDPSALSRVVEMFVLRDLIPARVSCERLRRGDGELAIEVDVVDLDANVAEHLVRRMRQMPVVLTALLERHEAPAG